MTAFTVGAIVTDIEGTTSSIAFVKDALFPYARARMRDFVVRRQEDVASILNEVRRIQNDPSLSPVKIVELLEQWADEDRKIAPLKTLQGMIWADGYQSGELQGHIYPDAAAALRAWRDAGVPLYVYSSGSVEAQQLIFRHSSLGDLTPLFLGYFDTRIGSKLEATSYARIASEIGLPPERLLFLSDHDGEIAAAARSGWRTQLVDRDGRTQGSVSTLDAIAVELAR